MINPKWTADQLEAKDAEIARLRAELATAKEQQAEAVRNRAEVAIMALAATAKAEAAERDAAGMREALVRARPAVKFCASQSLNPDDAEALEIVERALSASPAPPDGALQFLQRLASQYGEIVSSNDCSAEEIATARAEGRMFVDKDCLGYVHRPRGASTSTALGVGGRLEKLRAALEPFAKRCAAYDGAPSYPDDVTLELERGSAALRVGHLRAAKAALEDSK